MFGTLYGLALAVGFVAALTASVPVLVGIVRDARERRRKRRADEMERYAEDEEYGPAPPENDGADSRALQRVFCRSCGAENGAEFAFCRHCAEQL